MQIRIHCLAPFFAAFAALCAGAPAGATPVTPDSVITVTGYLEDGENAGTVEISVAGSTGDYVNYVIIEKGKGRDLKKFVGRLVTLSGTVHADKKKSLALTVEKYEVVKNLPGDSGLVE